jgi:hyperosmotically inducible protein
MKQAVKVVMVMVVVLALNGCQAMTGRTVGQTVDDASITTAVKTKLAADRVSSLTRVDVDTTRGTVYLNGVVESPDQKARAEELASQVGGVNGVVNNLQVQRPTQRSSAN